MTRDEQLLEPAKPGEAVHAFRMQRKLLGLTDEELQPDKSICVIGAGNNVFAAGVKKDLKEKSPFVMGVDPASARYKVLDPKIINHDARALGFPENFEGFDTVVSFQAIPKYFFMSLMPEETKKAIIADGKKRYDYTIAEEPRTKKEAIEAISQSLLEMLRITKPGGRVVLYPIVIPNIKGATSPEKAVLDMLGIGLWFAYPGLKFTYTNPTPGELPPMTNGKGTETASPANFSVVALEIRRPAKKSRGK